MKAILLLSLTLFATNSFAGWTEIIDCTFNRGSVDEPAVVSSSSIAELAMDGPHNGERGEVTLVNDLAPSYSITYSKFASGRNDEVKLVTKIGEEIVALSSVDTQQNETVTNRFLTQNGSYQITVTCSSTMK